MEPRPDPPVTERRRRFRWRRRWVITGVLGAAVAALAVAVSVLHGDAEKWSLSYLGDPAPSPDGSRIAFVAVHERRIPLAIDWTTGLFGNLQKTHFARLWILDRTTGQIERTMVESIGFGIDWHPDSSAIALISGDTARYLHLERIDLPGLVVSSIDPSSLCFPAHYSPDGRHVGWVRVIPPNRELVIATEESGQRRVVSRDVSSVWHWTPDGRSVIYLNRGTTSIRQYTIRDDTDRVLYTVGDPLAQHLSGLVVSPDGESIAFSEWELDDEDDAFIQLDLSSRQARQLFQCSDPVVGFAWRGRRIAYLQHVGGNQDDTELRLFDVETGASHLLARGRFREPRWLSDTELLVVDYPTELRVFDVESGASTILFSATEP